MLLELRLGFREESKLSDVQGHGADNGGKRAGPQGGDSLVLRDARESIDDGSVVCALLDGLQAVGLHANEGEISRVTYHGCNTARSETSAGALTEADLSAGFFGVFVEGFDEGFEETHTGGGVDRLTQETGRETGVEVQEFSTGDDIAGDAESRRPGAGASSLACQLQADFDHIDGLDAGGCSHTCETTVDEWEGSYDVWLVQDALGALG